MPVLDLNGAAPLEGFKSGKRTLTPQNTSAMISQGGGLGGFGGFAAAKVNRLNMDFFAPSRGVDQDLFADNKRMRARARDLSLNNPHVRNFLARVAGNVVGHGVILQAEVKSSTGKETSETEKINQRIEEEWVKAAESKDFSADGKMDFVDLQHLAIKNCAREGENVAKKVFGLNMNPWGFALQMLDNDQLDDTMMLSGANDAEVRMGVEVDKYKRPQAYWLFANHPNDMFPGSRERKRVPAELVIHTAQWERPGQTRGYSWLAPVMLALNQYSRYEEAVVVAARTAAAKVMTIEEEYSEDYIGDEDAEGDATNSDGTRYMAGDTGEIMTLAPGQKLNFTDPKFPTNTHKDFTQTMLRNIASGMLMQYPFLANDLEGVNFSSVRAGLVDERDMWRVLQRWFITHFVKPVFEAWLSMAMLTVLKDVTLTKDQIQQMTWHPRGWDWVDPLKDADAAVLMCGNGFSTRTIELAKRGLRFRKVVDQIAVEQEYMKSKGVNLGTDVAGDQAGKGVAADETASDGGASAGAQGSKKPAAKKPSGS